MKGDFTRLGYSPADGFTRVLMQQGRVQLDSDWNELQEMRLQEARTALRDLGAPIGVPAGAAGFQVGVSADTHDLTLTPGRLHLGGLVCENWLGNATLSLQPFLRTAAAASGGTWPPAVTGRFLAYLDVWERTLSALEAPAIRETALGGPDTAERTRLIWQLRLESVATHAGTEDFAPGWVPAAFAQLPGGQMFASTAKPPPAGPCTLPPGASYTALTNQLYRVEVQGTGTLNADGTGSPPPTFKWSRTNGSVAALVTGISGQALQLSDFGPDDALGFALGQVVELADEPGVLAGQVGTLLRIATVEPTTLTVTIDPATPVPPVDTSGPVLLRRWDQPGSAGVLGQAVAVGAGPIALEAGIQVAFQPGFYRAGDYWAFAARTAIDAETGDIVWPGPGSLPPQGIEHLYAPLALVDYTAPSSGTGAGTFVLVEDCRAGFAPAAGRFTPMLARYADGAHLRPLVPGQSLRLDQLAQGLMLASPVAFDTGSVSPVSIQLLADLPVAANQLVPGSTDASVVGTTAVTLGTTVSLATSNRIVVSLTQPAQNLLTTLLAGGGAATPQAFLQTFFTADFTPTANHAAWQFGAGGTVQQTANNEVFNASQTPYPPSLALANRVASLAPIIAGVSASISASGTVEAGMVFNWTSNSDYWTFTGTIAFFQTGPSSGSVGCRIYVNHYLNGTVDESFFSTFQQVNTSGSTWSVDLDIGTANAGLVFSGVFHIPNQADIRVSVTPPGPSASPGSIVLRPLGTLAAAPVASGTQVAAAASTLHLATTARYQSGVTTALTAIGTARLTSPTVSSVVSSAASPSAVLSATTLGPARVLPGALVPAGAAAVPSGYPAAMLAGARLGLASRGEPTTTFTRLHWVDSANNDMSIVPPAAAAPVLLRLRARRTLLRTFAEAQAAAGAWGVPVTAPLAPEPDFETAFYATPVLAGYYGSGFYGQAGIGNDQL